MGMPCFWLSFGFIIEVPTDSSMSEANHRTWIEGGLLFILYVCMLGAISSWLTLRQPMDFKSQPTESYSGEMHRYRSSERYSKEMLAVWSSDGRRLANFACSQIHDACAGVGIVSMGTVKAMRSVEGGLVPVEILRADHSVLIGREEQIQYLEAEQRFTLNLAWGSVVATFLSACAWLILRVRRRSGASFF
jgi:hypothetical protein